MAGIQRVVSILPALDNSNTHILFLDSPDEAMNWDKEDAQLQFQMKTL
jgi:hypothetical protein